MGFRDKDVGRSKSTERPDVAQPMARELNAWRARCAASIGSAGVPKHYSLKPVTWNRLRRR